MAPHSSIVSINGKRYDTKTGQIIGPDASKHNKTQTVPQGSVIDGVVRRPSRPVQDVVAAAPRPKPVTHKQGSIAKHTVDAVHKPKPAKILHQTLLRSKTLHRAGLGKPAATPKVHSKSKVKSFDYHLPTVTKPMPVDKARQSRANKIPKSSLVRKFLPYKSPAQVASTGHVVLQGEVMASKASVQPAAALPPIMPTTISSATHGNIDDLVDHALATATAHKQKPIKKHRFKKPRVATALVMLLVVLLLGGFYAYQYVPNFAMRVASQRAGIDAQLPGYQPSGFSFGSINTSPGTVEVSYLANANQDRRFKLMQKSSNWDSQSLLSNFVKFEDSNFQSAQDKGKTVYIYDNSNATWVSGGIWYVIDGQSASLNSDQLLKIAASL